MRTPLLIAFVTLALVGCDRSTSTPERDPDARVAVDLGPAIRVDRGLDAAAPPDGALPDAAPLDVAVDAAPPDVAPPDAAPPDAAPPPLICPPFPAPPIEGEPTLADTRLALVLPLGAPPGGDAVLALDLDGDPEGRPEVIVARGGRVEAFAADGRVWWRTPTLDVDRLIAAPDLDGDGRRELVAAARRTVWVLDGLTGRVRWRLPDDPFGDGRGLTAVQLVRVIDLDDDELPDLYITDSGCGDDGTGRAVSYRFAGPVFGAPIGVVDGPRLNGRCARWHTFAAADGGPRVVVTDGDGLNLFDPRTGARIVCGGFEAPPNGPLPHLSAIAGDAAGWFVVLPDAVAVAVVDPTAADADCPGGRVVLRWRRALAARSDGAVVLDLDGDGFDDLIVAAWSEADALWRTHALSGDDGEPLFTLDDARALGHLPGPGRGALLVAVGDPASPPRFAAMQRFDLEADPPTPSWALPVPRARPIRPAAHPPATARTEESDPLLSLPGPDGEAEVILVREGLVDGRGSGLAERLERIDPRGQRTAARPLLGQPGVIARLSAGPAAIALGEAGGQLVLLDAALSPIAPDAAAIQAPAGASRLAMIDDGSGPSLVALTPSGDVALLDAAGGSPARRWQVALGAPRRGSPSLTPVAGPMAPDGVLVREARVGDATWAVLDGATGQARWRSTLDPDIFRPIGAAQVAERAGRAETIVRADLLNRPDRLDVPAFAEADCPPSPDTDPAADAPAELCPGFVVKPRVVTGLDPATGECRWRLVLRPHYPCGGPSNQALSVADGDGDGLDEVWLTETTALRRIDAVTGALLGTADLGFHANGALRGGGWVHGSPGGVVRAGGNGPVEAFDPPPTARWSATNPDGLRLQGWIGRDALSWAGAVWASPARGYPVVRWDAADGAILSSDGYRGQATQPDAPLTPEFADVQAMLGVDDLAGDGAPGVLLTLDDGHLHALDADGRPAWSRALGVQVGRPVVASVEPDAPRSILVPAADGRVLVFGPPGPVAPPLAWDLPCPGPPSCDGADDIDVTERADTLCAAWTPVEGIDRYGVRVVGENGAEITGWVEVDTRAAQLDGLELVPGQRYAIEVRSVAEIDGRIRTSAPRATDGVEVRNDAPPQVAISAEPPRLAADEPPTVFIVRAADDDRLAGWSLELRTVDDLLVRRLASAPLAQPRFEARVPWNLEDRQKRPVAPGIYEAVATVVDRAGNTARARAAVEVCAEPCGP